METFGKGDILFILLILTLIHAIMLAISIVRRRRSGRPGSDPS